MTQDQATYGYLDRRDDYLKRLRRIEGQARGLQKMVEDEKYCDKRQYPFAVLPSV